MLSHYQDTAGTIGSYITFLFPKKEELEIPTPPVQHTVTSLELQFEQEIESGMTQEVAHTQQHLTFPSYDDKDLLNWDVAIITPPPRPSGTVRVKLKYKGRSKPFPIENSWED